MCLPAVFLENEVKISCSLFLLYLILDGVDIKVLHDAVDKIFLSRQPLIQSLFASHTQATIFPLIETGLEVVVKAILAVHVLEIFAHEIIAKLGKRVV